MGDLTLTPWRRYGHDRVYVARNGTRLGFLNRLDGSLLLDDGVVRAEVEYALAAAGYLERTPSVATPSVLEPWALTLPGDTATYKAGAGARAMAREKRDAAPVRTTIARLLDVHTDERAWRRGAEGEEAVARELGRLPEPWTVLHDLTVGDRNANVDHLVIGPGGVFTLNTKNLSGKVWVRGDTVFVNGARQHYVRNARHEAARVARLLSRRAQAPVFVHGAVVVITPALTVKQQPKDVTVVGRGVVRRWLESCPRTLTYEQVKRLERFARNPGTWR